ncbi:MAG: AEC family transporter [Clostridium sp.]|nr:AEC family transporter [Clostridium sp.]
MGEFLHAVSAVFMIFSLMAVGYLMGHLGWMTGAEKKFLSRFVVNIAVPLNCIVGVLNNLNREDVSRMGRMLAVPFITIITCLIISEAAAKVLKLPKERAGVFVALAFISNTMFIGLPLSTQLFGEVSVPFVMLYYMGSTVFTQTVAVLLVERSGRDVHVEHTPAGFVKDLLTKPPILGIIASMTMLFLEVRPPEMFMSFAKYMSNTVSPLALMYCGFIVYEIGIRNIRLEKGMPAILVIRLLAAPAICAAVCMLLGVEGLCRSVFIVEAALPSVSQITVMAGAYGADEEYAAAGSILTTLGIFLTIPVLMVVLT